MTLGTLLATRPHFHQNQKPNDEDKNMGDSPLSNRLKLFLLKT